MIAALIFDFDGLIVDTETPALESWQRVYAEYGYELSLDMWERALGSSGGFNALDHLASLTSQQTPPLTFDRARVRAYRDSIKAELTAGQPLLPGVLGLLDQAQALGLSCAIASSSRRQWVESWLRHHQIYERFVCIYTADNVRLTKPAPDLFLGAAACLGVEPDECLVFEDSSNGILAARAAGMRCVAVPGAISSQMTMAPADLVLPALDALPLRAILARFEQQPRP